MDIQLETGEYFLSNKRKQEKQAEKTAENKRKRDQTCMPPKVNTNISFAIFFFMHNYFIVFGLHFRSTQSMYFFFLIYKCSFI